MLNYESKAFSTQKRNAYVKIDIFDLELLLVNTHSKQTSVT